MVTMVRAYPNLPVRDISRSVEFFRDKIGLPPRHQEEGFAILTRDSVELHLWQASDESWRHRNSVKPIVTGAESFIAGTASCRIRVEGAEEFYAVLRSLGIVHDNAPLTNQPWGDRDFAVPDLEPQKLPAFSNSQKRKLAHPTLAVHCKRRVIHCSNQTSRLSSP